MIPFRSYELRKALEPPTRIIRAVLSKRSLAPKRAHPEHEASTQRLRLRASVVRTSGFAGLACGSLLLFATPLVSQTPGSLPPPSQLTSGALSLPDAPQPQDQQTKPDPQGPPPASGAPTLGDLGITPTQAYGDDRTQALLDKRSHMLKVHQRLGLITALPILAACISGAGAVPDRGSYGSTTSRDVHVGIAGLAIGMYGATAYYAAAAPRVGSTPARGGIKLHKYLIYIHAPGMVLTPILGAMAFNQANSGEKVHGIASAHQAVAVTTAITYGASILAVSYPIHLHLHNSQPSTASTALATAEDATPSLKAREAK